MSHFTVLAVGDDYEAKMAPYDENIQVAPYVRYDDDFWYARVVKDERPELDHTDLRVVLDAYNEAYPDVVGGDEEYLLDEQGMLYYMTTYNPDSHRIDVCPGYTSPHEGQEGRRSTGAQALWEVRPDQAVHGVHEGNGEAPWVVRLVQGLSSGTQLNENARAEATLAPPEIRDLAGGLRLAAGPAERLLRCLFEAIGSGAGGGPLPFDGQGPRTALQPLQHALGPRGGEVLHASCGSSVSHAPHITRDVLIGGSKWDYWRVGGRWAGAFLLKRGADGYLAPLGWEWEPQFNNGQAAPDMTGRADQARKGDIDIEGMRQKAVDDANVSWNTYERIVAEHGSLPSEAWRHQDWDRADPEQKALFEAARTAYWEHPTVKALQDAELIGWMGFPHDLFGMEREEGIERARLGAVPGYAFLYKGVWYEPGKMGWWGMSSDDNDSRLEYWTQVNAIVDDLPNDALLTMIDCHI